MRAGPGPKRLARGKTKHLVLPRPFRWQVGEASNAHSMRQPAIEGLCLPEPMDSRLQRVGNGQCDRCNVAAEIETEILVECRIDGIRACGEKKRIAIRNRSHDEFST
jgi:hypothetical protein